MGRCLQTAISAHAEGGRWQGASRQLSAGQGALRQLQGLAGRGSLHNRHCQSKRIWPAATASASYGQLCAGCMISAHAEPGTAQVAGGIKAAARCGRGRCPSRRWPEHAHWPWSCRHVFKARVLCCNASSKWAVSDRDRQAQRSNHGSDCSWLALQCKQQMGNLGQRQTGAEKRSRQ